MNEYAQFVNDYAKPLPTFTDNIKHSFIGMLGELGELADAWKKHELYEQPLNTTNILEELGDFDFYFQLGVNQFPGIEFEESYPFADAYIHDTFSVMAKCIAEFFDYHNDGDEENPMSKLRTIDYCINSLCVHFNYTREEVRNTNMTKLRKRYPEKYSNEHAKLRLDKND